MPIKPRIPSEHEEQTGLILWARANLPSELRHLLFAIPNGGLRTPRNAHTLKAEGVVSGIPDLFFAHPIGFFHGLFIEMKRGRPGQSKISTEQAEMIIRLKKQGYACKICYGCIEAIEALKDYLASKNDNWRESAFKEYKRRMELAELAERENFR